MRASTQKLTTAAAATALAVIMCAMSAYLPLSIMPLYFAAFCIFLAVKRGNIVYGALSAAATVAIMFAFVGLSLKWFFLLFMFAPYGLITSFVNKFNYFKLKTALIRAVIAVAYFNLTFGLVYIVAINVATVGLDVPVVEWVSRLGGYPILALIATVVLVPLDFIFSSMSIVILKRIPAPTAKGKGEGKEAFYKNKEQSEKYDIFGYEVKGDDAPTEQLKDEKTDDTEK